MTINIIFSTLGYRLPTVYSLYKPDIESLPTKSKFTLLNLLSRDAYNLITLQST